MGSRHGSGKEGGARGAEVGGEPASVLVGVESPDSVRVPAEAQFVAEPDRGDLRGDHAAGDRARIFPLGGRFAHEAVELHRVLQSRVRQAVPLDVHGPSTDEGNGVRLGRAVSQGMIFASSAFNYEKSV